MDTVPAVQMPHRFAGDAFPSAVRLSSSGEPEYLLDNSRKTSIAFKFNNGILPSYLTRLPLGLLVLIDLQLEIEMEDGSWKEAKPVDFPGPRVNHAIWEGNVSYSVAGESYSRRTC